MNHKHSHSAAYTEVSETTEESDKMNLFCSGAGSNREAENVRFWTNSFWGISGVVGKIANNAAFHKWCLSSNKGCQAEANCFITCQAQCALSQLSRKCALQSIGQEEKKEPAGPPARKAASGGGADTALAIKQEDWGRGETTLWAWTNQLAHTQMPDVPFH